RDRAGEPAYMLSHPNPEGRRPDAEPTIAAEKLKTPAGRPQKVPELAEVQAVANAIADPAEVVVARYRRPADEKPDDAERQFLLGRGYQNVGQLEAARTAPGPRRDAGGPGG